MRFVSAALAPLLVAPLFLATAVAAQTESARSLDAFRQIPIHSAVGVSGEVWAAGATYKVRLDGRFEFFPALGSARPQNLPWAWHTESIRVGNDELLYGRPTERVANEARYEYARGGVVEVYELDRESVEQTFHLSERPAGVGSLVVSGRIDTPLFAPVREAEHAPLTFFAEDGASILEYGAATVIDADGHRFPMPSSFDGSTIELRLPESVLEAVRFPIVIDPVILSTSPSQQVGEMAVAMLHDLAFAGRRLIMTALTRVFSASDHDLIGMMSFDDFDQPALVATDLSSSYSNQKIAVGAQDQVDRFVIIAEQRQGLGTHLWMRGHYAYQLGLNQGTTNVITAQVGEEYRNPRVGTNNEDSFALIVYDHKQQNVRSVRAVRWETSIPANIVFTTPIATTTEEVQPDVTQRMHGSDDWVVVWSNNSLSTNYVRGRQVKRSGVVDNTIATLVSSSAYTFNRARVAGSFDRFLMTYGRNPVGVGFSSIRATRFDWEPNELPNILHQRLVQGGQTYTNRSVAYDYRSNSHWAAAYNSQLGLQRQFVVKRLGYTGGVVATWNGPGASTFDPYPGAVSFARHRTDEDRFGIVYAHGDSLEGAYGDILRYDPAVYSPVGIGGGCSPDIETVVDTPSMAGRQVFKSRLTSRIFTTSALFVGPATTTVNLTPIGMTWCALKVDPAAGGVAIPAFFEVLGGAPYVQFSLPDSPVFLGTVYTQWAFLHPTANPLGVVLNQGYAHTVL